jgi:hypothetical protein
MRTSSVLLSLSTLAVLSAAGGACAQAQPAAPGAPAALPEIAVLAALPRYPIKLREARAIRGMYDMSNGWTVEVRPDWRRVFVEINGRKPLEVIPISADKFVSRDGNMALDFNLGNGGDEMVLRYVPDGVAAQAVVATSTLAWR